MNGMGTFGTAEITVNNGQPMHGRLNIEHQIIDVTSSTATKPAMSWTVIDDQGHFHAYDNQGELPTLVEHIRHVDCDEWHDFLREDTECEGYSIAEYFCAICDQQIEPERVPDTGQKSIPGRMSWEVQIQPEQEITGKVTVRIANGDKTLFGVADARTDAWSSGPDGVALTTRLTGIGPLGERRG
jgi:hypothetical protein